MLDLAMTLPFLDSFFLLFVVGSDTFGLDSFGFGIFFVIIRTEEIDIIIGFFSSWGSGLWGSLGWSNALFWFFVDPAVRSGIPVDQFFLLEPKSNFSLGRFNGVRTVANITSDLD